VVNPVHRGVEADVLSHIALGHTAHNVVAQHGAGKTG
jgi:hypothetical protein